MRFLLRAEMLRSRPRWPLRCGILLLVARGSGGRVFQRKGSGRIGYSHVSMFQSNWQSSSKTVFSRFAFQVIPVNIFPTELVVLEESWILYKSTFYVLNCLPKCNVDHQDHQTSNVDSQRPLPWRPQKARFSPGSLERRLANLQVLKPDIFKTHFKIRSGIPQELTSLVDC